MKLLFDANLSRRLASLLAADFPGSIHASVLGSAPEDIEIWDYAKTNGFLIGSKDSDFYRMSVAWGAPPKVIWLRIGNGPTRHAEHVLRNRVADIATFEHDDASTLLIIDGS